MSAGWRLVKLNEVCEILRGGSPRPISDYITEAEDGINWIKIGDVPVGAKYLLTTKEKIKPEGAKRSRQVKSGDFLLSNSMSFGRPYILRTSGCIHDGWLVLRDKENQLNEDYLYHVLSSDFVYAQFKKFAVGAVVKNLNIEVVEKVEIPLPTLPEQIRIAAILDKADALRVKRREALAQLDSLTQAIFIEMFGDPVTNPKGWAVKPFESQIESVRYGTGSPPPYSEEGLPFIRATNIKGGTISTKDLKRISPSEAKKLDKCKVHYGNLIVVRSGVNTGDCAMIPHEYAGAYAAFDLIVDIEPINGNFYSYLINSAYGQLVLAPLTRRAAQPHLNAEQLRTLEFIVPPSHLKDEFANCVSSINRLKEVHKTSLAELDNLFASLQHRAFRGEL